ncbi:MAG TPA: helix-turn-helix transcriptional regulator [Streptosporangiaceae bacterium]|nr:helix-turn-helix transcriptional regulator [Streptosporangiaceae bacterium]
MRSQHDISPFRDSPFRDSRRARPLLRTTLGEVLRRIRLGQDRTLSDVAQAAKVSMQYLSEIERGRKEASSEVLAAICDALETDLPDVLAAVGRELAGAMDQRATVIRLAPGPDQLAVSRQPAPPGGDNVVCLLAA